MRKGRELDSGKIKGEREDFPEDRAGSLAEAVGVEAKSGSSGEDDCLPT